MRSMTSVEGRGSSTSFGSRSCKRSVLACGSQMLERGDCEHRNFYACVVCHLQFIVVPQHIVLCVAGVSDLVLDIVAMTAIAAKDLLSVIVRCFPSYVYGVADPSDARRICPDTWITAEDC